MSVCKLDNETDNIKPPCKREESFMSVLPDGFNIIEYRSKMEAVNLVEINQSPIELKEISSKELDPEYAKLANENWEDLI